MRKEPSGVSRDYDVVDKRPRARRWCHGGRRRARTSITRPDLSLTWPSVTERRFHFPVSLAARRSMIELFHSHLQHAPLRICRCNRGKLNSTSFVATVIKFPRVLQLCRALALHIHKRVQVQRQCIVRRLVYQ